MKIPRRIASVVINSLKGGVVPRIGLPYITVGREAEIDALLRDVEIIAEGGASFRFIVGRYGSGKSFLLQTIRNYVMDRNFVVADADLSPERRLQGARGQGLATYKELIQNLSTENAAGGRRPDVDSGPMAQQCAERGGGGKRARPRRRRFRRAGGKEDRRGGELPERNGARLRLREAADGLLPGESRPGMTKARRRW